jgi:hypothetical protein
MPRGLVKGNKCGNGFFEGNVGEDELESRGTRYMVIVGDTRLRVFEINACEATDLGIS